MGFDEFNIQNFDCQFRSASYLLLPIFLFSVYLHLFMFLLSVSFSFTLISSIFSLYFVPSLKVIILPSRPLPSMSHLLSYHAILAPGLFQGSTSLPRDFEVVILTLLSRVDRGCPGDFTLATNVTRVDHAPSAQPWRALNG